MREKRDYKKLIASCVTLLCMAFMILTVFYTDASDESTVIQYQEGYTWKSEDYRDQNGAGIAPEAPEGYLFAGWYTMEGTTYKAVSNPTEGAEYYAKFVPEEVLGIKAQISKTLTDDNAENDGTTAAIRFVTSIDNSKAYQHVGFNIKKGSTGTAEDAKTTNYIYRTLYAVNASDSNGEAEEYVPEELFHEASYYFKTWTIRNIAEAAYNTEITVIPYWITLDGTRVEGTKATKVATVNLGRSWIYINETANEDGKQYGTKKHPYNDFATALDNIVLDKNGKILLQSDYTAASTFDWKSHGKDITVTGVNGGELLDFSAKTQGTIRDGVTFTNMQLKLFSAHVYAAGNRFEIAADVTSDNPDTVIYGGAYGTSVEETNVTIRSGSYMGIYGGGVNAGGTVTEDTHVTVENCDIFSKTSTHTRRVHGGGKKATVEGNTYVTIGQGFNAGLGDDCVADSMYSTVYGGGFGETSNGEALRATVKGNTYVTILDGAGVNYVFGAGGPLSTVEGTSHIYFKGGQAMGIYGGSNSTDSVNAHTFVQMTGGTVEQIFGGNHKASSNMTGSSEEKVYADVQVLGGTVTRRIYGGCYNDCDGSWATTNSVNGYVNVSIGADATISNRSDSSTLGNDTSICSISRLADNATNEIGVMVLNPGVSSSNVGMNIKVLGSSISDARYTDFLVNVGVGGTVVSEKGTLHISADTENGYNYATVTYGDEVLGYVKGEGKCSLPELTAASDIQTIQVTFSEAEPDIADDFVVKSVLEENATYYTTLEEAVENAEAGTEIVVLDNITVNSPITMDKNISLTSENAVTITRGTEVADNMFTVTAGTFSMKGATDATITLEGNKDADGAVGARAIRVEDGATCETSYVTIQNFSIDGEGGAIYAVGGSSVTVTNCQFTDNIASTGAGAIRIIAGATVTSNNSKYSSNKTTSSDKGNGGAILCHGTYNDTNSSYLNNTSARHGGAIIVQSGGIATLTGTDSNAMFSGNTASANANGNAVYINSGATVSIIGYSFAEESQKMLAAGTLTFGNITGASIVQGSAGKIYVTDYDADTNSVEIKPNSYTIGKEVVLKAEELDDNSVFEAACADITITADSDNNYWWLKSDGTLMRGVARIETDGESQYYNTLEAAVGVANENGGTGEATDVVIYVYKDVALSEQISITKNIVIQNESGESVTIMRGNVAATSNMFYVGNSSSNLAAKLTLGSNEESETGTLIIDGGTATSGRIIENRATATFVLGRNATLQNASNTNWGSVLCNRGTAELNGIVTENVCKQAGGAIIQVQTSGKAAPSMIIVQGEYTNNTSEYPSGNSWGGVIRVDAGTLTIEGGKFANNGVDKLGGAIYAAANTEVIITGGTFLGNTAAEEGSAIYCLGNLNCKNVTFEGETVQTLYVNNEFTFDNITGATIVQGAEATLNVTGYDSTNIITVTPSTYTAGTQLLNKSSDIEDAEFEAACAGIKVTPDDSDNDWWIKSDGTLVWGEACIGTTCYETLEAAVEVVNDDTGIGETENITIEVMKNTSISNTVTIEKNITIVNTPNSSITISRASNMTALMFKVASGASMTLGTNESTETGKLTVNGYTATKVGTRIVDNYGTFTLGGNAILTGANTNATPWGCALINRGTAYLSGSITDNTCAGACGAVLQYTGTIYIYKGTYTGNSATRSINNTSGPSMGGFLRVYGGTAYIYGGNFSNNSTTGNGGAIYIDSAKTAYITGGIFSDNTADQEGNDVYVAGTLNYNSSNVTTSTDGIKGSGTINSDYSGQ